MQVPKLKPDKDTKASNAYCWEQSDLLLSIDSRISLTSSWKVSGSVVTLWRSSSSERGEHSITHWASSTISCSIQVLRKSLASKFSYPSFLLISKELPESQPEDSQIPSLWRSVTSCTRANVKMEAWIWEKKRKQKWDRDCSVSFKQCGKLNCAEEGGYITMGKFFPFPEKKAAWWEALLWNRAPLCHTSQLLRRI